MSHLILHMLSEAQLVWGNTDLCEEEVDSADEVTKNGVIDHTLEGEKAGRKKTDINSQGRESVIYHTSTNSFWQILILHTTLIS